SLVRVVTKLAQGFERSAYRQARGIDKRTPPDDVERFRRVLSALIDEDAHVVSVRGIVIRTAVRSFERRDEKPTRAALRISDPDAPPARVSHDRLDATHGRGGPVALIFDSGWMRYDPHVAKVRLP